MFDKTKMQVRQKGAKVLEQYKKSPIDVLQSKLQKVKESKESKSRFLEVTMSDFRGNYSAK